MNPVEFEHETPIYKTEHESGPVRYGPDGRMDGRKEHVRTACMQMSVGGQMFFCPWADSEAIPMLK